MSAKSTTGRTSGEATSSRSATRSRANERVGQQVRHGQYMISPLGHGMGEQQLTRLVQDVAGLDVVRTLVGPGTICPPVIVARATPERIATLRRTAAGTLIIESDELLRAASLVPSTSIRAPLAAGSLGPGFTTAVQVVDENEEPIPQAEVWLIGQRWTVHGTTGAEGRVELTLPGELPETIAQLVVEPRTGYWGVCRIDPELQDNAVVAVALRRLSETAPSGWARQAMRFDQLPAQWRGGGAKIALIDSGAATTHEDLSGIAHGFDTSGEEDASWFEDPDGHGTRAAGIISAASERADGVRGYAPDAELHVCKLAPAARCSGLVAALDYCIGAGIDVACLGFGCERGSMIIEHRIAAAKQKGMAVIAAAGSTGGAVHFPASSRHVLAVGAVGQIGTFPDDSPQASDARGAASVGGFFVPAFSCRGPEIDLGAPGVGVVTCQSPDGYVVADGTSLAAPHAAALAALLIAHHPDFQREFARRDARRVERLFQILKDTARPLSDRMQSGAGLPDAARALGLQAQSPPLHPSLSAGLEELRHAMRRAGLAEGDGRMVSFAEPVRGPAIVTNLPLNTGPFPYVLQTGVGIEAQMRDLKTAMQVAGLSGQMEA